LKTNQRKLNRNKNVDITQEINTVEWFFGYGGNHIGLKRVIPNLCLRAVCEIEEYAIENILAKMENGLLEAAPIWSNCKTFPTQPFVDRVDLFIASYPCQPFSSAGKRQGENDERHLWPSVYMWIRATRPICVFLENVEGHVSMGLSTVISDLEEAGYETSWGIFSARECLDGNNETATHQRKRVFIMAHLKDNGLEVNNGSKIQCETSGRWTLQPWGIRSCDVRELANASSNGRDWGKLQDRVEGWTSSELPQSYAGEPSSVRSKAIGCCQMWPSRPGQPQHKWEPPRIVANSNSSEQSEKRGDDGEVLEVSSEQRADQRSTLSGGEGATMGNSNNNVEFDVSRKQYGKAEQPITSDSGCLVNAEQFLFPATREHGAMDETSGIPADGEGCEPSQTDPESSATRKREGDGGNASECNETQPEVGGDANGTSIRLDLPGMPTISHTELVEIFDWMVKGESRVDELRLLGNGVFPSTAEKAFRTLFKELIERSI
jgi:site-specific DNA-cytosine methylase